LFDGGEVNSLTDEADTVLTVTSFADYGSRVGSFQYAPSPPATMAPLPPQENSLMTHPSPADRLSSALAITSPDDTGPVRTLTTQVALEQPRTQVTRAEFLATAHGIFDARIGGSPVTDTVLNPGWTTYERRLQVPAFDVTEQVRSAADGPLRIEVDIAGGWWRGPLGWTGTQAQYGDDLAFLGVLTLWFEDGHVQEAPTDLSWTSVLSPITLAHHYHGQREDRRITPGDPQPVREVVIDRATLIEQSSPLITHHEVLRPERIWTSPSGKTLVDFGQNLVGVCRFTATGPAGGTITLRHAEVLENDELGTRPLRTAEATDSLTLAGDPAGERFEPRLTFHGFRFVEVTGWPGELGVEDIEAVVIGSALTPTSSFASSHSGLNQLISNVVWSQKGNFLAVPTDCPQRDERLGWTGDIAAFAATAAFQFDVQQFLHTWLLDLRAEVELSPNHTVPFVVPDLLKLPRQAEDPGWGGGTPTAIWGDAAVWVAEALWNAYGDLDQLREQYPGMQAHLASVESALSPTGWIRTPRRRMLRLRRPTRAWSPPRAWCGRHGSRRARPSCSVRPTGSTGRISPTAPSRRSAPTTCRPMARSPRTARPSTPSRSPSSCWTPRGSSWPETVSRLWSRRPGTGSPRASRERRSSPMP
jgi:alpha-L-rhamnosidase